jgi:hypothetical protein
MFIYLFIVELQVRDVVEYWSLWRSQGRTPQMQELFLQFEGKFDVFR